MFTNHFIGRTVTLEEQYRSLLEVVLRGILSDQERVHLPSATATATTDATAAK